MLSLNLRTFERVSRWMDAHARFDSHETCSTKIRKIGKIFHKHKAYLITFKRERCPILASSDSSKGRRLAAAAADPAAQVVTAEDAAAAVDSAVVVAADSAVVAADSAVVAAAAAEEGVADGRRLLLSSTLPAMRKTMLPPVC